MRHALWILLLILAPVQVWRVSSQEQRQPSLKPNPITRARPSPTAYPEQKAVNEGDVVQVDSNLVSVPASVMDRNGRYVSNLKADDFRIFEDGVEQTLADFGTVDEPITVVLCLDASGSMGSRLNELNHAAKAFVAQLRPEDKLSAVAFADFPWSLFPVTKIGDLRKEIKIEPRRDHRYTMLYDAVDYAIKRVNKVPGRRAIVLFSDGYGEGVFSSAKETLRDAEEQEALIYTVQFETLSWQAPANVNQKQYVQRIVEAKNYMRSLALRTGGRSFHIEDLADLHKTFEFVARELQRQYRLGYYPKSQLQLGERRQVSVKIVNRPELVVRARQSFLVDKGRLSRR